MKTILTILTVFSVCFLNAQDADERRGNKYYDRYNYYEAIDYYKASHQLTTEGRRKLAESYDMTGQNQLAENEWAKINRQAEKTSSDVYHYSLALLKNEKYGEAEVQLQQYEKLIQTPQESMQYTQLRDWIDQQKNNPYGFQVHLLEMNSSVSDYAPFVRDNALYYASNGNEKLLVDRKWSGDREPFTNVYTMSLQADAPSEPVSVLNEKYNDGPIAFSPDGNTAYLTRNYAQKNKQDGSRHFKLMILRLINGEWTSAEDFPYDSKDYNVGHAAVSPDGNQMIFSSDMPGGKGGADLYYTQRDNSGNWTTPVNLAALNTSGNENFPFWHTENILVFSSDGRPGFGGLDLYYTQYKDGKFRKVENMGWPMNSNLDDFGFWMEPGMKSGYFSSDRRSGRGGDDLYSFTMEKPFSFGKKLEIVSKSVKGELLPGTSVSLLRDGTEIAQLTTDGQGKAEYTLEENGNYSLVANHEDYFEAGHKFELSDKTADNFTEEVALEKDPGFSILLTVREKRTGDPIADAKVILTNNMTGVTEEFLTNDKGQVMRPVADKKINDRMSYNITLAKEDYLSKTLTYNRLLDHEGQYDVSEEINLKLEKMAVGVDLAKAIDLQPIYFDLGKATIRTDAAVELDKIVKVMNENPTMVVELGSHTDCRGSAKSNERLSQKRAAASAEYIKKRITNPERIYGKGYGEYRLLNACACEGSIQSDCTEEQHQENRRTEFVVVKM